MESSDIVRDVLGNWGKWQLRSTLLIFLCKIPSAWFMACIIFTAPFAQPGEYFCRQRSVSSDQDVWISVAASTQGRTNPSGSNVVDYCHVHVKQHNETSSLHFAFRERNDDSVMACTDFEHRSMFDSLVTQFDLVCSRTILIAVTQFFHLFGVLTGGIFATILLN